MKSWKRIVSLGLIVAMLLSVSACGDGNKETQAPTQGQTQAPTQGQTQAPTQGKDEPATEAPNTLPSWLHPGELPIVEEGTEKTVSVFVKDMNNRVNDVSETWNYKFIEEMMNINLETTLFTDQNRNEIISLAFAGDELPDAIFAAGFSTAELVKYGETEGQLIDLAPYITEEIMPNLYRILQEEPAYKDAWTSADGKIWSLGFVRDNTEADNLACVLYNYESLEELGMDVPRTLDEFYEVLKAYKAKYPDSYPLGGSYSEYNPSMFILNALGYVGNSSGDSIALRDGEVVFPVADREAYGEYLKFMNKLYEEELIHPDYFTMDKAAVQAVIREGKAIAVQGTPVTEIDTDDMYNWYAGYPLTSDLNDTAQWPANNAVPSVGNFVLTSACEDPELVLAWVDFYFSYHGYQLMNKGAIQDVDPEEWYLGEEPRTYDPATDGYIISGFVNNKDTWGAQAKYMNSRVRFIPNAVLGSFLWEEDGVEANATAYLTKFDHLTTREELLANEEIQTQFWWYLMVGVDHNFVPYVTTELFPSYIYLDQDTSDEMTSLILPIKQYAEQESAKFITGVKSFDELDKYFDELEALGVDDYVEFYQEYYNSWK